MRLLGLRLMILSLATTPLTAALAHGGNHWNVSSPNGDLTVIIEMKDADGRATTAPSLCYRVVRHDREVLAAAPLGITLKWLGQFQTNLRFLGKSANTLDERYTMPVGKRS